MATFLEVKQKCKILRGIREELLGIRDLFDEKNKVQDYSSHQIELN